MKIKKHLLSPAKQINSPNSDNRPNEKDISLIVIHCISLPEGIFNTPHITQLFTNQLKACEHPSFSEICSLKVSSHLLIDRTGNITQYVPFNQRAWHAGISNYLGREKCNDFSIGIELEGTDKSRYTSKQYAQLNQVIQCLQQYYPAISSKNITGHSDIAPIRKTDPGEFFDWTLLNQ
jgi:AmpD protein